MACVTVLSGTACAVEAPEPEVGEPICMLVNSDGHWNDGTQHLIREPNEVGGGQPVGCGCLPPEDRYAWDDETLEDLAALAFDECERIAETYYDFDWNDCQADYDARVWEDLQWAMISVGPDSVWEDYHPPDLYCIPPE